METRGLPGKFIDRHFSSRLQKEASLESLRPELQAEYEKFLPQIQILYGQAGLWHGTGRYQHSAEGQISDVLGAIAIKQQLAPNLDLFDFQKGEGHSVSTAPSRMYARNYARMFCPKGTDIDNLYGKGVWSKRVFFSSGLEILKHPSIFKKIKENKNNVGQAANSWITRITQEYGPNPPKKVVLQPLAIRTDIPNNYPILFGIKDENLQFKETGSYLVGEKRVSEPIELSNITHIEVPYKDIDGTRSLLEQKGITIPVIPIEFGEQYCRNFTFEALMKGGPLKKAA